MYIESVPNRKSPPAVLLRESYREGGKVRKRTLCNVTDWDPAILEGFRVLLKGGIAVADLGEVFQIVRSRPHGHVAAVLGTAQRIGLPQLLASRACRERDLCLAMVTARITAPASKLATARGLDPETLDSTLGELLAVEGADADELYGALDWLLARQAAIEKKLAAKHLAADTLVLYDVSSTYVTGRKCPLAEIGYSRDGKPGTLQIVFGLLCSADGCPVAVEVFDGSTGDPVTFTAQVKKVQERFGIRRVVWVGDRGMITEARIEEDLRGHDGLDWITALRAPQIHELVNSGVLQLSLFDEQNLAEITSDQYPDERLIACRNPLLAAERARKREDLLQATERELNKIVRATQRERNPLRGEGKIGIRVGKVIGRFKMAKHFDLHITEDSFEFCRNQQSIAAEAAVDGIYIIRTSVAAQDMQAEKVVATYKSLSQVERAFRSYKTIDLRVRPIHHRLADRVRAHVFLCMLAYYVEWHMRRCLAPMLFDDEYPERGQERRDSVVSPAERSVEADHKASSKLTEDGMPVHSFQTLLADLATLTRNRVEFASPGSPVADITARPTPVQARAFDLLGVKP